jgi:hypothetical protein
VDRRVMVGQDGGESQVAPPQDQRRHHSDTTAV